MSGLKIITDYKWRNILYGYELPERVRKDFNCIVNEEFEGHAFIKYRGHYYDVSEFLRISEQAPEAMKHWHGYTSDSYFSGVLIRLSDDGEQYQAATYMS